MLGSDARAPAYPGHSSSRRRRQRRSVGASLFSQLCCSNSRRRRRTRCGSARARQPHGRVTILATHQPRARVSVPAARIEGGAPQPARARARGPVGHPLLWAGSRAPRALANAPTRQHASRQRADTRQHRANDATAAGRRDRRRAVWVLGGRRRRRRRPGIQRRPRRQRRRLWQRRRHVIETRTVSGPVVPRRILGKLWRTPDVHTSVDMGSRLFTLLLIRTRADTRGSHQTTLPR
jgi:hypothetical protein